MTRNKRRFPPDFMFQLNNLEAKLLRSQIVTSKDTRGGRRYLPLAFTEQGIAMLSSVLNSNRAIQVNIAIMRAFVRLRKMLSDQENLAEKILDMERVYDGKFELVFAILEQRDDAPPEPEEDDKPPIGFQAP